jgi:MFS superfamily sulfate permease-like transporter
MLTLGVATWTFIDGIVIFGAAMLTEAFPPMPTPADAFMPMFPPTETFGAAMLRFIDGIVIFGASILMLGIVIFGASILRLGAAMLTEAFPPIPTPADAFMPMFPPTETFGAAMLRFIDGIVIFGASILRLGAAMLIFAPPETFAVISILPSRPPYLKLQLPANLLPKYWPK